MVAPSAAGGRQGAVVHLRSWYPQPHDKQFTAAVIAKTEVIMSAIIRVGMQNGQ